MSIWIKKECPMYISARKFSMAVAAAAVFMAPLTACSSEDSSDQGSAHVIQSSEQVVVQTPVYTPDVHSQYPLEPEQPVEDVVNQGSGTAVAAGTKSVISAASPREFEAPGDIDPGTYVFEPYSGMTASFYMSAGFQKLPDVQFIDELTLVTIPEGTLIIDHMQVFEATEAQINGLPHIDLSDQ